MQVPLKHAKDNGASKHLSFKKTFILDQFSIRIGSNSQRCSKITKKLRLESFHQNR